TDGAVWAIEINSLEIALQPSAQPCPSNPLIRSTHKHKHMFIPKSTARRAAGFMLPLFFLTLNAFAQNNASPLGKTNFSTYLSEVALPPNTAAEAAKRVYGADLRNPDYNALDRFYQP